MLKCSLFAAALMTGGVLASVASAEDYRAQAPFGYGYGQSSNPQFQGSEDGLSRFCPVGSIPHVWPNGDGVRCENPNGTYTY